MNLIDSSSSEKGATDVDRVYQTLQDEWADAELSRVLTELQVDAQGLSQDFHLLPGGHGSHGELWYRFRLRGHDAKGGHGLRGNHIGKGIAAVDEGCSCKISQPDGEGAWLGWRLISVTFVMVVIAAKP